MNCHLTHTYSPKPLLHPCCTTEETDGRVPRRTVYLWYKLSCCPSWVPSALPPARHQGSDGFQNSTWCELRKRLCLRKRIRTSQGPIKDEKNNSPFPIIPSEECQGLNRQPNTLYSWPEEAFCAHGSPFLVGRLTYNIVSEWMLKLQGCLIAWAQEPRFIGVVWDSRCSKPDASGSGMVVTWLLVGEGSPNM